MSDRPADWTPVVGVIGVGSMGRHHARVYSELPEVRLAGICDVDEDRADTAAREYGTEAMSRSELLGEVDAVSVAVPTAYHYDVVRECIARGVHVLVEKPFVDEVEKGRELAGLAEERGVTLQVGHIERFNPATRVLTDIAPNLEVVAVDVDRLGPPLDRENDDNVVKDLMIHDIDILVSLIDSGIESRSALAHDERHVTAQFQFENGCVATATASRLTQEKVRRLSLTAKSCRVNVDFISQSVEIHRRSHPEYVETDGDIRYRHESVIERPMVKNGEPLKAELGAFCEAVREGTEPVVTAEDALRVLEVVEQIEGLALPKARAIRS